MTNSYFEEMMAGFGGQEQEGGAPGKDGTVWGILRPRAEYAAAFPDGIPFSAVLVDSRAPAVELQFALAGNAKAVLPPLRALDLHYQHYRVVAAGDISLLKVDIKPSSEFYLRSGIHSLMAALPGILADAGSAPAPGELAFANDDEPHSAPEPAIAPPQNCPLCGLDRCDSAALLDGVYRPTHAACLESRLSLPDKDLVEPPKTKGTILTGILGALVGALVAAIPIWSLMLTRGRVYSVIYAFIPLLSALLYRVFRGKADIRPAALSVLGASVLAALALEQVWYWLVVVDQLGYNVSLASTIQSYFSSYTFLTALRAMWLALLFMIIGYLVSSIWLRRYTRAGSLPSRVTRGAGFVRATVMPLHPAPDDAPAGAPSASAGPATQPEGD